MGAEKVWSFVQRPKNRQLRGQRQMRGFFATLRMTNFYFEIKKRWGKKYRYPLAAAAGDGGNEHDLVAVLEGVGFAAVGA
jgi:hypothetical protein